jgi:thiosulfate/3-mercaptopyruvate sulfurtransferase
MKKLRVRRTDIIICYDNLGIFSSARAAWMMRYFGAESVRVLNGGFKKWQKEGRPV